MPVLHSSACLLKLATCANYTGSQSIFIRTLLDKKYALPYRYHVIFFSFSFLSVFTPITRARSLFSSAPYWTRSTPCRTGLSVIFFLFSFFFFMSTPCRTGTTVCHLFSFSFFIFMSTPRRTDTMSSFFFFFFFFMSTPCRASRLVRGALVRGTLEALPACFMC